MIYGTHNSATSSKLVWWQRPFSWIINLTSKCQNKSIEQQLKDGVRLFNLQVTYYKNNWYFSHGLAIYEEDLFDVLKLFKKYAKSEDPIYFQLYLDKCFWTKQDQFEFAKLVSSVKYEFCCPYLVMLTAWIEGTNKYPHKSSSKITIEEHYWSAGWAKNKSWVDKIPLPKRHAKIYNQKYKDNCKAKYLMLDFYNIN